MRMLADQNFKFQEKDTNLWNEGYILEPLGKELLHVYLKEPHLVRKKSYVETRGSYVISTKNISKMVINYKKHQHP